MADTCRNGHERTPGSTYVYPAREGRKPRITCRICRDGEPQARPSQEEHVAVIAAREAAFVPKELGAFGALRFWGMCLGISLERHPLRMAWLMAQMRPELVEDIRQAADLLERGIYVFDAHDGDVAKIRARIEDESASAREKEVEEDA